MLLNYARSTRKSRIKEEKRGWEKKKPRRLKLLLDHRTISCVPRKEHGDNLHVGACTGQFLNNIY